MSESLTQVAAQAATLSRRATVWGIGHAVVALALLVYAFAGGADQSWFLLAGLIVAAGAGGLYFLAGLALKQSASAGRGKVIMASLLGLNWLMVVSFLAVFNCIMHPELTVTSGLVNLLVGFVAPLAHLVGNLWFLVAGLNLDTGKWLTG